MDILSTNACFGGANHVIRHASEATGTDMTLGLFLPPEAADGPVPVLWFLSGLTCTHENAMTKAGAQGWAAETGIALVFPDTSPRGAGVADDEAFDLGQGAGFYVDAAEAPWAPHFAMRTYVMGELPALLAARHPLDMDRQAITGHSMGGHGALTLALGAPGRFRSASAFAPIGNPTASDWGRRQFAAYLGDPEAGPDASRLLAAGTDLPILTDTGTSDQFAHLLGTGALFAAAAAGGAAATMRMQAGYDHSYYTVASFMEEHVDFHARHLFA